jgi:uncharacterized protein YggE
MLFALAGVQAAEAELCGAAEKLPKLLLVATTRGDHAGEAEVKVPADRVLVSLRVRTDHRSRQQALRLKQEA